MSCGAVAAHTGQMLRIILRKGKPLAFQYRYCPSVAERERRNDKNKFNSTANKEMIQGKTMGDVRIFRAVAESTTRIEIACSLERKHCPSRRLIRFSTDTPLCQANLSTDLMVTNITIE